MYLFLNSIYIYSTNIFYLYRFIFSTPLLDFFFFFRLDVQCKDFIRFILPRYFDSNRSKEKQGDKVRLGRRGRSLRTEQQTGGYSRRDVEEMGQREEEFITRKGLLFRKRTSHKVTTSTRDPKFGNVFEEKSQSSRSITSPFHTSSFSQLSVRLSYPFDYPFKHLSPTLPVPVRRTTLRPEGLYKQGEKQTYVYMPYISKRFLTIFRLFVLYRQIFVLYRYILHLSR